MLELVLVSKDWLGCGLLDAPALSEPNNTSEDDR
jgi:hypothetical protein